MDIKFVFREEEHNLQDLLLPSDLFDLTDDDGEIIGKIITRPGIGRLCDKLGDIQFGFGPIQTFEFNGETVVAIEVECQDLRSKSMNRYGRDFGEASMHNCNGVGGDYPVSMAVKRGKARALIDLLGIRGVYSEDEAKEFKDQVKKGKGKGKNGNGNTEPENEREVVGKINEIVDKLGLSVEDKLNIYREVLQDDELSAAEIRIKAGIKVKKAVLSKLEEKLANAENK